MPLTITEFLDARIAEDESVARAASHQKVAGPFHGNWRNDSLHFSSMEREDAVHMARHDPARVLAECAAKRALIMLSVNWDGHTRQMDILRTVAAVYKDHQDYRQEWAK